MTTKTADMKGNMVIKKTSHGYVVVNTDGSYENHSHFTNLKGAQRCILLIKKKILPNDEWWREALRRLLTEEEFAELRPNNRNEYYNVPRGQRR